MRAVLAAAVALVVAVAPAHAQRSAVVTDGVTAPAWMFDVSYAAASSAGYGALRLAGVRPAPAAALAASVNVVLHLRGWAMGDYRPSADWLFDFTTRGGPAVVLAVCETKGRRWCVGALAALAASYVALTPSASP